MTALRHPPLVAVCLLLAVGCRLEQRPPAGPAREQAAAQAAVTAYYDAVARGDTAVTRDPTLAADSLAPLRMDVQVVRDLATAWVTVRTFRGGVDGAGPRLQLLVLRRTGGAWSVIRVVTAAP